MDRTSSLFIPAKLGRASEDIALQIEAAIVDGRIEPGERLPSERDLTDHFKTGRGVIREAFRILKQKGLIDIKKGAKGGAVVRRVEAGDVSESLALFFKQHPMTPEHIIEFRECLDRTITPLAISRATGVEKTDLTAQTQKFEAVLNSPAPDPDLVAEMDRNLNIRLAGMAKNPIFELMVRAVQQGLSSFDHGLYQERDYRAKIAQNWQQTARYIAEGEPLKALSAISYHYAALRQRLEEAPEPRTPAEQISWKVSAGAMATETIEPGADLPPTEEK